ncbi:MAG: hypothetical protein HY315_01075 [Acidobacteria bacterium]|nr:hypothetical protein [Acidobacteriota bacterium]
MIEDFKDLPNRISPYILLDNLNQPVPIAPGPFRLIGATEGVLHSDLLFRWVPTTAVEFDGSYEQPHVDLDGPPWSLVSDGERPFSTLVLVTHTTFGSQSSQVRGITQQPFDIGAGPFDQLRFSLANFPDYIGAAVQYERNGNRGFMAGRLETFAEQGRCQVDKVLEATDLAKRAGRDAGFVVSHVGLWVPSSGAMTVHDAEAVARMLHFWFGFLRGAWAGPLFPQGLANGQVVWRQFASWKLSESREVPTWLPQRKPIDLSSLFLGFVRRWNDPQWQGPLVSAISWFIEANSSRTALESRIVLAQVAIDLLAWVHLVETERLHSRTGFKRLSAADRIRVLLHRVGVPATVPDYFTHLSSLLQGDAFDGPGVITKVRNSLVHSGGDRGGDSQVVSGIHLLECSQLALQYVELGLLAICGHNGHYARRGWRGWKGDDEIQVPWRQAG